MHPESERKHPLANCESCPLRETDTFVPSEIPSNPRLIVVGEAPGGYEAKRGRPFVGPSGQLLDQVLSHHGYTRNEVMFTNVCLCRPKDNATPSKSAIAACRPRLLDELRAAGASDVVALGGTAADALVDDARSITKLRVGPPKKPTRGLDGSAVDRVIPTWHPAYCLRAADNFPTLVSDIGKLKDVERNAWSPPVWKYFDTPAGALEVLSELQRRATHLVVDIEVGIEKDIDFGHPNEYELLAVGLGYARGKAVVLGEIALRDRRVLDGLKLLLEQVKIIAHNGKFDLGGLYPHIGGQTLWFDTMLASYCIDERPGNHGLKTLAVERLGAPQYDLEILEYVPRGGNYSNIPRPLLYKYNAFDVACTWELYELFTERLEREDQRRLHDFMVAASNQLMYLELNGITIDRQYMNQLRGEFIQRLDEIEATLSDLVCKPVTLEDPDMPELVLPNAFNPRSPKQIKEHLDRVGVKVEKTDHETLEDLLKFLYITKGMEANEPVVKFIQTLLVHRRQQKLFSTYVEGIRKRLYRGRVYTTYLLHGTTSGRLASRNPNLQNIVRDNAIRKQFAVAKPGSILIQADMKQAEGRVMCALAQDEYLRQIFTNPNADIFNELTDQLYGQGAWTKEQRKEQRIRTKAFFYGIGYGREPYSIALEYNMSVREAEQRYNEFLGLIPGVVAWQEDVKRRVHSGEDLVTSFGRRRRFWLITEQNQKAVENEALSFLPQSISSDITLDAFTRLRPMLRGLGFIRLTIHDALTAECAEERKDEVAQLLMEEMEAAGRRWTDYVPFRTDVSFGTSWGEL